MTKNKNNSTAREEEEEEPRKKKKPRARGKHCVDHGDNGSSGHHTGEANDHARSSGTGVAALVPFFVASTVRRILAFQVRAWSNNNCDRDLLAW